MTRIIKPTLSLLIAIVAIVAGITSLNPTTVSAESSGLDNFHFFQEPPEANEINMIAPNDRSFKLSDLKGKVVLLNFWRQNCQYCQQEKEYLKEMKDSLKSDDLTVLCVDFWDRPAWVKSYAGKNQGNLLFAFQPPGTEPVMENISKGRIMSYFILNQGKEAIYEVKGFPSTYVIDREGKVVAAHLGMAQWTDPKIIQWLKSLTGPQGAPFSSPDDYYELPTWLDRLLAGPVAQKNADN